MESTTAVSHYWKLRISLHGERVAVPIADYTHLCTRIGEMVMSYGISSIEIERDGEPYRFVRVRNPLLFHCYRCEKDMPLNSQSTITSAMCQQCADAEV